jgi:NADH dehydrogenase
VLFNSENHLVFSPLLAEVAGSSINELDVVVPLRQLLRNVFCRTEEVVALDLNAQQVHFVAEDGGRTRMDYDHLVIACGNVTDMNAVPGMADHAFPLKTVGDAARLRSHIMEQMELAELTLDQDRKRRRLSFVVVGGGYSGVEAAGEINDLVRGSARYFRNWLAKDVRVVVIHSREQLLPEISPGLREFARQKMETAGVEILLRAAAQSAHAEGVLLEDGRFVEGRTIVCTVGNSPAPIVAALDVPKHKGRLVTEPDMRLQGYRNAWAVGDCAHIINAKTGQPSPTTGQFAEREGRQCAENILSSLERKPTRPFRFKPLGELCSIGGHSAVADILGMHLSGFLAWFIWRGVYLFKLPTFGRRLQVGFDWAWLLLFPRDLANVRTDPTDRVTHAHFRAGDYIFREGDPPSNFYVLEDGEVELLPSTRNGDGDGEVVSVLGSGSFFGERALLNKGPRRMSVRARTDVNVLVLGKNVFTQISGALAPLRDALAQALNRRAFDAWQDAPHALEALKATPVSQVMEPVPQPILGPDTPLREVARAFGSHHNEFFFVVDNTGNLSGIITITDLIRARNNGAHAGTPAGEFMSPNPLAVAVSDSCATAATAMGENRLKTLPVVEQKGTRKLAGCLRARRLLAFIFERAGDRVPAPRGS